MWKQLELWGEDGKEETSIYPHFDSPCNDNELMLNYQYEYLQHNDQKAFNKLWLKSTELAMKFITVEKEKKGFILRRQEHEDKATEAVMYVLRRYKNKGYYIKKGFPAAIYHGVIHALYYRNKTQEIEQELERLVNNNNYSFEEALEVIKVEKEKERIKEEQKTQLFLFG